MGDASDGRCVSASDHEHLLRTYQPVIRFDSHEAFFAHDVRAMADNRNFVLSHEAVGAVIARHGHSPDQLSAEFLTVKDGLYPNREPFQAGDHFALDLVGPDAFVDKIGDYREIERKLAPEWRNCIFGRAVTQEVDGAAELWLQYWFFYIYNDAQFAGRNDLHEGDWEMIEILVAGDRPVTAVYAQHAYAEQRAWSNVEVENGRPVVYSARGGHGSYFEAGLQRTYVRLGSGPPPDRLVVTTSTPGALARTDTIVVESLLLGEVQSRSELDADKTYTVRVSTISVAGVPSAPGEPITLAPVAPDTPPPEEGVALSVLDRFWRWVGSALGRPVKER